MLKLLIAEDEDIIRKGLAYTIDWVTIGYILAGEAADGQEGYEKIIELKPDVVIADIIMPKYSGIEMIRRARKKEEFESVILTSYAEFEYAKQAIELQAYEYLLKPVDVDKLKEVMAKLYNKIEQDKKKNLLYEQDKQGVNIELLASSEKYENPYIRKAIDIIINHYMKKLNQESISNELNVSSGYLSRKFKEVTGLTYLDFLNQYRIQQAIKLLDKGIYKIYQISDMTGFTNYKHFCSVFKKYTKLSPMEFIKQKHS